MKLLLSLPLILLAIGSSSGQSIIIGAPPPVFTASDNGNANLLITQRATLAQPATLQSISFYVTKAGGSLLLGVFDASGSGGRPGHLLATTTTLTPTTGWNTASVVSQVSLPAGTLWLA